MRPLRSTFSQFTGETGTVVDAQLSKARSVFHQVTEELAVVTADKQGLEATTAELKLATEEMSRAVEASEMTVQRTTEKLEVRTALYLQLMSA